MGDFETSIIETVREICGLTTENEEFDNELIPHINASIVKVNQVGAGNLLIVHNDNQLWDDLIDPDQISGNEAFPLIILYVALSTKVLFDPPPPSSVEMHNRNLDELLWRIRAAYEE